MVTFTNLAIGFAFNLIIAVFIVRFIYYPAKQNKNFIFTFIAFNTAVYFVIYYDDPAKNHNAFTWLNERLAAPVAENGRFSNDYFDEI